MVATEQPTPKVDPEIDCLVRVKGKNLRAGDFTRVKVTSADGYDLASRAIGEPW